MSEVTSFCFFSLEIFIFQNKVSVSVFPIAFRLLIMQCIQLFFHSQTRFLFPYNSDQALKNNFLLKLPVFNFLSNSIVLGKVFLVFDIQSLMISPIQPVLPVAICSGSVIGYRTIRQSYVRIFEKKLLLKNVLISKNRILI